MCEKCQNVVNEINNTGVSGYCKKCKKWCVVPRRFLNSPKHTAYCAGCSEATILDITEKSLSDVRQELALSEREISNFTAYVH